jgi:hypothetical protein
MYFSNNTFDIVRAWFQDSSVIQLKADPELLAVALEAFAMHVQVAPETANEPPTNKFLRHGQIAMRDTARQIAAEIRRQPASPFASGMSLDPGDLSTLDSFQEGEAVSQN